MDLENIKFYCTMDLKIASIILGIQCASATYCCIYCEKDKNEFANQNADQHSKGRLIFLSSKVIMLFNPLQTR